ncbi:hypothetical protein AYI68_g5982 [Smittium mucronatum]|uniref:Uncharacterized protein n=1 Tax=Smittium mucronatum TaxID=133383 RepID=A0A1R0GSS9_9FUNG|nr:hypothetical protein AYI68_g5982 [Smittium mucronatum]
MDTIPFPALNPNRRTSLLLPKIKIKKVKSSKIYESDGSFKSKKYNFNEKYGIVESTDFSQLGFDQKFIPHIPKWKRANTEILGLRNSSLGTHSSKDSSRVDCNDDSHKSINTTSLPHFSEIVNPDFKPMHKEVKNQKPSQKLNKCSESRIKKDVKNSNFQKIITNNEIIDSIKFKKKVESIRSEVGDSWLRVFSEMKSNSSSSFSKPSMKKSRTFGHPNDATFKFPTTIDPPDEEVYHYRNKINTLKPKNKSKNQSSSPSQIELDDLQVNFEEPVPYFLFPKKSGKSNNIHYSRSSINKVFSRRNSHLVKPNIPNDIPIHRNTLGSVSELYATEAEPLFSGSKNSDSDFGLIKDEAKNIITSPAIMDAHSYSGLDLGIICSINHYTVNWASFDFISEQKSTSKDSQNLDSDSNQYNNRLKFNFKSFRNFKARISIKKEYLDFSFLDEDIFNKFSNSKPKPSNMESLVSKEDSFSNEKTESFNGAYQEIGTYKISEFLKIIYVSEDSSVVNNFEESNTVILEYKTDISCYPEWFVISFPESLETNLSFIPEEVIKRISLHIEKKSPNNNVHQSPIGDECITDLGSINCSDENIISNDSHDSFGSIKALENAFQKINENSVNRDNFYKKMQCVSCGWVGIADQMYRFIDKILDFELTSKVGLSDNNSLFSTGLEKIRILKNPICINCGSNYLIDYSNPISKKDTLQNSIPLQMLTNSIKLMMELSFFESKDEKIKRWAPCGIMKQRIQTLYSKYRQENFRNYKSLASRLVNPDLEEIPIFMALSNKKMYFFSPNDKFWNSIIKSASQSLESNNLKSKRRLSNKHRKEIVLNNENSASAQNFAINSIEMNPYAYLDLIRVCDLKEIKKIDVGPNRQYLALHFKLLDEQPFMKKKIDYAENLEHISPSNLDNETSPSNNGKLNYDSSKDSSKGWIAPFLPRFMTRIVSDTNIYPLSNETGRKSSSLTKPNADESNTFNQAKFEKKTLASNPGSIPEESLSNNKNALNLSNEKNDFSDYESGKCTDIPDLSLKRVYGRVGDDSLKGKKPQIDGNIDFEITSSKKINKNEFGIEEECNFADCKQSFEINLDKINKEEDRFSSVVLMLRDRLICSDWLDTIQEILYSNAEEIVDRDLRRMSLISRTKLINHDIEWAMHHLKQEVFLSKHTFEDLKFLDIIGSIKSSVFNGPDLNSNSKDTDENAGEKLESLSFSDRSTEIPSNLMNCFQKGYESANIEYQPYNSLDPKRGDQEQYKKFNIWNGFKEERRDSLVRLGYELEFFKTKGSKNLVTIDATSDDRVVIDKVTYEFLKLYFSIGWIPEYLSCKYCEYGNKSRKRASSLSNFRSVGEKKVSTSAWNPETKDDICEKCSKYLGITPRTVVATSYYMYLVRERVDIWPPGIDELVKFYERYQTEKPPMIVTSDDKEYDHLNIGKVYKDRLTGTIFNPANLLGMGFGGRSPILMQGIESTGGFLDRLIGAEPTKLPLTTKIDPKEDTLNVLTDKDDISQGNSINESLSKNEPLNEETAVPLVSDKIGFAEEFENKVNDSFWAAELVNQYDQIERVCPVICVDSLVLVIVNAFVYPKKCLEASRTADIIDNNEYLDKKDRSTDNFISVVEELNDYKFGKGTGKLNLGFSGSIGINKKAVGRVKENTSTVRRKSIDLGRISGIEQSSTQFGKSTLGSNYGKKEVYGMTARGWQVAVIITFDPKLLDTLSVEGELKIRDEGFEENIQKSTKNDAQYKCDHSKDKSATYKIGSSLKDQMWTREKDEWKIFFSSISSGIEFMEAVVSLVRDVSGGKRNIEPTVIEGV